MKNIAYKIKKGLESGSFTVEAAMIMPVVLLVTFSSLYLCFYVHNRAFLTSAACEAAVCGSIEGARINGDTYEAARDRSILLGNTGFFGAENLYTETAAGTEPGSEILVAYELDTIFSPFGIHWHLKTEGRAGVFRPASEIRRAAHKEG